MPLTCQDVADCLDKELRTQDIPDASLNGLQVEGNRGVRKIALAVDASVETFRLAIQAQADLVIVHHGIFWNQPRRLCGPLFTKVQLLIQNGMGLYASHLPLDCHPRMGNNALLAKSLKLSASRPFGHYHGHTIGIGGRLASPLTATALGRKIRSITGANPRIFAFGKKRIKTMAIVSGGAGELLEEAASMGYDAFLTGEMSHACYHTAREEHMHVVLGGHYATETFGVRALGRYLQKRFRIHSVFLDVPTGL
ncbi:Nif3-like dinuclear metal center hexameric protein [candidate division FCPU426 bacterium]|nr:Nif3-like dinuclear metal center hexameric protein [candidate division FCPU426 bacterium]